MRESLTPVRYTDASAVASLLPIVLIVLVDVIGLTLDLDGLPVPR
jgi:hypothetical protein